MITLRGRNVNELYARGIAHLHQNAELQSSRAGKVYAMTCPVVSVYEEPMERVLFDGKRNANPFFHLMEGLWMLAGRDDAKFLNHYVSDFGERFAEDGLHVHGAYGYRWRKAFDFDQLDAVVEKLKKNTNDRQAVIQMWDARGRDYGGHYGEGPEWVGCNDLLGEFKDRPCNTHAYVRVRDQVFRDEPPYAPGPTSRKVLDLTICCRSNDVVFGAYGANAVHFSMLQEYLAGRIGADVGTLYQFSNNYHGYVDVLERVRWADIGQAVHPEWSDPYEDATVHATSMATDWDAFDGDLKAFMDWHDNQLWMDRGYYFPRYVNSWLWHTASAVAMSNHFRVHGMLEDAAHAAAGIGAPDWRMACEQWIERAMEKRR